MSDKKTIEQPVTVLKTVLSWSKSRPMWQQDALRRIVVDGTPDDHAVTEILELCKKEFGDTSVTTNPEPLSAGHLPVDPGAGESIGLASISNVVGVNQLATSQTLQFETNGLTIVYGPNGTGKSGYTRILKKACRSRHAGDIMPDVYRPEPTGNATADLNISRSSGSTELISWEDDGHAAESLSAITVFDRDAASVHVRKKNEVWFRPFGLDIPNDLAGVCQELKARLTSEKETLERQRNAAFTNPIWSNRSSIGKTLSALKHDTNLTSVTPVEQFSEADEILLTKLQTDLAQDGAAAAASQRGYAARLEQLATYLRKIEHQFNDAALEAIINLKTQADDARSAADVAATDAFSGLQLEGVGGKTWRSLWESARAYSLSLGEVGLSFPPNQGEVCVVCHQDIDDKTAERLGGFEAFIKHDTEKKAAGAEQVLADAVKNFKGVTVHVEKVSVIWQRLKTNDFALAKLVLSFLARARLRQRQTLAIIDGGIVFDATPLPVSQEVAMNEKAAKIRTYAASLEADVDGEEKEKILSELAELMDSKQAEQLLEIGKAEIARLEELLRIEICLKSTATTAITRLGNAIADDLITPLMRNRFQQEIVALAGSLVRVEVVRSGGKFGSPQYEVKLFANPKAKVHDVLSEGEQTCVALASYLTELANASHTSALVFDDPVTSLDHRWRSKVAKRLTKEAGTRQVVVFTHDMIFVNDLHQMATTKNIPVGLAHLSRGQDSVGIVRPGLPWTASGVRDRLDKLEKEAREAKLLFEAHDDDGYKSATSSLYSHLRATWERALEDIVFANVLMRHRDYINTTGLKRVTALEDSDVEAFQIGFKKCCDFVDAHDPSRGHDPEPPDPAEMMQDIQVLKGWSEALRTKMNAVS